MYKDTPPRPPPSYAPPSSVAMAPAALAPRYPVRLTWGLVAALGAIFLAQWSDPALTERFAVRAAAVREGEWWRLVTGAFLHVGVLHLAANAYFGGYLGAHLERFIGPLRLLALTVAAMAGSGLAIVAVGENAVGFSGVVYGWLAAWLAFHLTPRFPALRLSGPQRRSYLQVLLANLLISLIPGISLAGHAGGFVAGFAAAWLMGSGRRRPPIGA